MLWHWVFSVGHLGKKVYRPYKNFDLEHLNLALKSELEKLNDSAYYEFETAFCSALSKHVPIKIKMLTHNNSSIVYWGYQNNFKPICFFFDKKISRAQKHVTSKNQLTKKNKLTLNNKVNNFSSSHKLLGMTCFCAPKIFSSKRKKKTGLKLSS